MRKILSIILVMAFTVGPAGCGKGKPAEEPSGLYQYKTEYVGDNSRVSGLVNAQTYPESVKTDGIEILSEQEPYGLNVFIETDRAVTEEDLFQNAAVTFSLVGNLDKISYIDKNDDKVILQYDRSDVEEILKETEGKTLEEIGKSPESLTEYLE